MDKIMYDTLYKTQYGSRLYGTHTPTSDTDWKVVYLPKFNDVLLGKKLSITSVTTGDDKSTNTMDDVDTSYIPLHTFARDFYAGQTYALEVAFAFMSNPQLTIDSGSDQRFFGFVTSLTQTFLTSNVKAMVGYAMNQAQMYGVKGSRLGSVEKLYDYLLLQKASVGGDSKLETVTNWVNNNQDKYLFTTTYENNNIHLPAISIVEKLYPATITLNEAISRLTQLRGKYGERTKSANAANGLDWKALSHAIRITIQAIMLLNHHKLVFPLSGDNVNMLLDIKYGNIPFETVHNTFVELMDTLDAAKDTTSLPDRTPELDTEFEEWLVQWLRVFYFDDMSIG
jgi:hypothetical protein